MTFLIILVLILVVALLARDVLGTMFTRPVVGCLVFLILIALMYHFHILFH